MVTKTEIRISMKVKPDHIVTQEDIDELTCHFEEFILNTYDPSLSIIDSFSISQVEITNK